MAEQEFKQILNMDPNLLRALLHTSLTDRQSQVAQLLGQGSTKEQIAANLRISTSTIAIHIRGICGVLGIRSYKTLLPVLRDFYSLDHTDLPASPIRNQPEDNNKRPKLTPQLETVWWAATRDLSNLKIGETLGISIPIVNRRLVMLYQALGYDNLPQKSKRPLAVKLYTELYPDLA